MSEPFLSEIRIMSFDYAPKGWARCDGQLLPIGQYQGLFSILGTIFGGDGRTTFALPDLRGRVPVHADASHPLAKRGGEQAHRLSVEELPAHSHALNASSRVANAEPPSPLGNLLADSKPTEIYGPPAATVTMHSGTIAKAGGSEAHPNMQPFVALNFCIALLGAYPSRD